MTEKTKLNILMITARADFGGGPEHIYQLVRKLKDNFNIFIACPNDEPYFQKYAETVSRENLALIPHRKFEFSSLLNLRKFIRKNKISLIHSHGRGGGIYGRILSVLCRIPCVHTFHGLHIEKHNTAGKLLYLSIERMFAVFTDKFISISKSELRIAQKFKICTSEKVEVISNGVPLPKRNIKPKFDKHSFNILTITRDDPVKNNLMIIKIYDRLMELYDGGFFKWTVIGDNLNTLSEMTAKYNFEKYFSFPGPSEDLSKYFTETNCYVNTSVREGFSLSILEAMAYGIPIVASEVDGNCDIIENGVNGFLFKLDDPKSAAESIVRLSKNESLYSSFSVSNRQKIESDYTLEIMVQKTKKLYYSVLNLK